MNILGTLKSVLFKQLSVIGVLRTLSSICNGTFYELANGWKLLIVFAKGSTADASQGANCASECKHEISMLPHYSQRQQQKPHKGINWCVFCTFVDNLDRFGTTLMLI